ncbi:MAG: hypothetical protein R3F56_01590 [Planctomycetota bacterium]
MFASPSRSRHDLTHVGGLCALLACGALLHLLQLHAPFGFGEGNAGSYFACVAKGYRDIGFFALRGSPFVPDLYGGLEPYLHHPPGGFWLAAMFGADEAGLRGTTLLAHLVATVALVELLRPSLGSLRALLAGAVFLVLPVFYIDIQASQWPFTIAFGLLMLLGYERQKTSSSRGWRALTLVMALLGPWADWHFGFFCLALVPLTELRAPGLRRLAFAWGLSGVSLLLFLLWRQWAAQAPIWSHPGAGISNAGLVQGTILSRPPFLDQLRGMASCSNRALTLPVLAGLVLGLPSLLRRAPRLTAALVVAGLLGSLLFGNHVLTHTDFPSMLGALAAASASAMLLRHRAGGVLGVVVLAAAGWQAYTRVRQARTAFFRDYGRAATAATHEVQPDGSERRYVVASDLSWGYRYYVDSSDFLILPLVDPAVLEQNREALARMGKGVRYLRLRFGGRVGERMQRFPDLDAYLARFPSRRLPELEQSFEVDGELGALRVAEARLVTIEP